MKKSIISWVILSGVSIFVGAAVFFLGMYLQWYISGVGINDYDLPNFIMSGFIAMLATGIIIAIKQSASAIARAIKDKK